MVTIEDYKIKENDLGESFCVLIVNGGVTPVKSKETNNFYFTTRKASVPVTFDETMCKTLIGSELQGNVISVSCEPYQITNEETGEIITRNHRYQYVDSVTYPLEPALA